MKNARITAAQLGLNRVALIADFPITTAVYGYIVWIINLENVISILSLLIAIMAENFLFS